MLTMEVDRFVAMQRAKLERRILDPGFFPLELRGRTPTMQMMLVLDPDLVAETKNRIALSLGIVNIAILGISGMLSYFLAGKTLEPIQKMVEEQKRFIGDASHELRTPLTALKSAIEVNLRDKKMSLHDAKDLLATAKDQVDRLTHLSNALLELSGGHDSNGIGSNIESTNIADVAKKVTEEMQPLATEKRCLIIVNADDAHANIPNHDAYRLISILVDNAIKYSRPDTQVKISVSKAKKNIILKVEDQGIGISDNDLVHIFDRFYRADSARTKESTSGYGLGLAIAKKIVDTHKGKIEVKSKEGEGSTFRVLFSEFSA